VRFLIGLLIGLLACPVWAEPKVGDVAQNLKVLPPWTMRQCQKTFFATYDQEGAKKLKLLDNDCHFWNVKQSAQTKIIEGKDSQIKLLLKTIVSHEAEHALDEKRQAELVKQLKKEIEEKNKYKYQPNFNWLYIAIGAAVAIAGVSFGAGVWLTKK
jgi:hypothetical protein